MDKNDQRARIFLGDGESSESSLSEVRMGTGPREERAVRILAGSRDERITRSKGHGSFREQTSSSESEPERSLEEKRLSMQETSEPYYEEEARAFLEEGKDLSTTPYKQSGKRREKRGRAVSEESIEEALKRIRENFKSHMGWDNESVGSFFDQCSDEDDDENGPTPFEDQHAGKPEAAKGNDTQNLPGASVQQISSDESPPVVNNGAGEEEPFEPPSEVPFGVNLYYLLAKHGKNLSKLYRTSDLCRKWSDASDWAFPSIKNDFSPWKICTDDDVKRVLRILVCKEAAKQKGERKASLHESLALKCDWSIKCFRTTDWKQYQLEKFSIWQCRGLQLEDEVPERMLQPGQSFVWGNNSCPYDALFAVLPHVCQKALQRGLYAGENDRSGESFKFTFAARIIAGMSKIRRKQSIERRQLVSHWVRHLIQDLYEYEVSRSVSSPILWNAYKPSAFSCLGDLSYLMPMVLGATYKYNGSAPIHVQDLPVPANEDQVLQACRESRNVLEGLLTVVKRQRKVTLVPGVFVIQIGTLLWDNENNRSTTTHNESYEDIRAMLISQGKYNFQSDGEALQAEIIAHVAFKDASCDHFVGVGWCQPVDGADVIFYDGLLDRGASKRFRRETIYSSAYRRLHLPTSKFFVVVSKSGIDEQNIERSE